MIAKISSSVTTEFGDVRVLHIDADGASYYHTSGAYCRVELPSSGVGMMRSEEARRMAALLIVVAESMERDKRETKDD